MKIIFLCGSLEAGRDGVGDYTRRLAGELIRQGHQVAAIALNDKHIVETIDENQEIDGVLLKVLRISFNWSVDKGLAYADKWIKDFEPEWISLQHVSFAFHSKGLPIGLALKLKSLVSDYNFHLMFHELWVGLNGKVSLKMQLLRFAQKKIIQELVRRTNPDCITTSIPFYKKSLSIPSVELLPLFSNIPVISHNVYLEGSQNVRVVHFGNFTGMFQEFELQLQFLKNAGNYLKKGVQLISVGEGGPFKNRALEIAKNVLGEDGVNEVGYLSAHEISVLLQIADVGISRSDYMMSGKSGTTIAMLEHGLPVLLRGKQANINDEMIPNTLYKGQLLFCDSDFSGVTQKKPAKGRLSEIAENYVNILNQTRKKARKV